MNVPGRKPNMIGHNIRPGHTPGGFTKPLGRSPRERDRARQMARAQEPHRQVIEAANQLLGSSRFGP